MRKTVSRSRSRAPGSLILTHSCDGHFAGLNEFPREDRPPVAVVSWSSRIRVGLGGADDPARGLEPAAATRWFAPVPLLAVLCATALLRALLGAPHFAPFGYVLGLAFHALHRAGDPGRISARRVPVVVSVMSVLLSLELRAGSGGHRT